MYVGVCQTCDIKNGARYESVLNTKYTVETKCEDCRRFTNCCKYTVFWGLAGVCNACFDNYLSDNEPKICFKAPNTKCDVCHKQPSVKQKCYYTEPIEKEFCVSCLIKRGATRKQLIRAIPDSTDATEFRPLAADSKHNLHFPYDQWTCTDEKCSHPICRKCKEKHTLLCKMTVYENRVDMCSDCWINFNKTTPKTDVPEPNKKVEKC